MPIVAKTDSAGRFELRDIFGNGATLYVRSADGAHQTTRRVDYVAVRSVFGAPIELKLEPATAHEVTVSANGKPAADVTVVCSGHGFIAEAVTGMEGKARLLVPATAEVTELAGWHGELGVDGVRTADDLPNVDLTRLNLRAPKSHVVRVVDSDGKPVGDLELGVSARMNDNRWISVRPISASHAHTGGDGTATISWVPRDGLKGLDVDFYGADWKIDEIDRDRLAAGETTVHARRRTRIEGRLVMPDGASAEGILISGFGIGPGGRGDIPYARARRDGTFTLPIASDHGYVLGIADRQWASNPWLGVILKSDGGQPTDVAIDVYPATPLRIRVTRGAERQPVADTWIDMSSRGTVTFMDAQGKERNGRAGISGWLKTDEHGVAVTGVGQGEQEIRLANNKWTEERTIQVKSAEPVEVDFHRAWLSNRRIAGRLTLDGQPYTPAPSMVARAWTERSPYMPLIWQPQVSADGTFEVTFDAESASVLVMDREQGRSGFVKLGPNDSTADVAMQPTATYSGTLLDENDKPMAGQVLKLQVDKAHDVVVASQPADEEGKFKFAAVPANVPIRLVLANDNPDEWRYFSDDERAFLPGEVRGDGILKSRIANNDRAPAAAKAPPPLAETVARVCQNAAVARMRGLAVLAGDNSGNVTRLGDTVLSYDDSQEVLSYVTLRVTPEQLKSEATALAKLGWPLPAAGEVVLVALDGDQKAIATDRFTADGGSVALGKSRDFLKKHKPPTVDAVKSIAAARDEAKATNRRVWLVLGGPRCGPCFRLARWMHDHHAMLESDYVIVKVMGGLDENYEQAVDGLPIKGFGIPCYVITEPDGKILVTSEGPLGNIGMPSSIEGIRHLRGMLERTVRTLSPADVDALVQSLAPQK
ncbi:MAG: thioredoxin family protein [Pirellulales bacterium]